MDYLDLRISKQLSINGEHTPGGALLLSLVTYTPDGPPDRLPSVMSYVGVPLVSSTQGCLVQKPSYEQDRRPGDVPHVHITGDGVH